MNRIKAFAARILIVAGIFLGSLAVAPYGPQGCVQYTSPALSQQSTDQIILRAEQTAQSALLTFDTFVRLERDNEAVLKAFNPQIHEWANTVRRNGLDWVKSVRTATKTFKANRDAANQATLTTAITTLTSAVAETQKYITQSKKVAHP